MVSNLKSLWLLVVIPLPLIPNDQLLLTDSTPLTRPYGPTSPTRVEVKEVDRGFREDDKKSG